MSAERLREAANALRDPVRCNRPPYEDALADWLDEAAQMSDEWASSIWNGALDVADAILGDAS